MAKKKPLLKAEVQQESAFHNIIMRWLGLAGIFIAASLFLFSQDSAQIKITLFYIAVIGAAAFWLNGLIKERVNIISSYNFTLLFPFILYFSYIVISFFFQPYIPARLGAFTRFIAYSMLFIIAAFNFNNERAGKFFKYLIIAAWAVAGYGMVQIIDRYLLPGFDVLTWTDFFHERIFSTIANPNFLADFCLFSFFVVLGRFIYKPSKGLIVLLGFLLLNIAFTMSKGAWLALAAGLGLYGAIYFNFFSEKYKNHRLKYNLLISGILLVGILAAGIFTAKRMQSVNFRLSTWRSAFEMIESKPVFGTGLGSFKYIYTAYKRPEIFYMEGIHNGETQHAESYPVEQACELGLTGLGLFLLLIVWQCFGFFRKLKILSASPDTKKAALTLLTCFSASAVIYIHNIVDVSIYFVSTSYFLVIFNGILFALNFGPLRQESKGSVQEPAGGKLFKAAYVLFTVLVLVLLCVFMRDFYEMSAPALKSKIRYFVIYWFFFLTAAGYTVWLFLREAFYSRRLVNVIIFALAAGLMYMAFLSLRSDFYTAAATGMAGRNDPAAAAYYYKAVQLDPLSPSLRQFSGIVFQNRADMAKTNRPYEGDPSQGLYNDYDRALSAYRASLALIPNDTMIHYNLGALYHDMAKAAFRKHDRTVSEQYYKLAEASLKRSLLLDPTFDNAYYQLANIALEHNDFRLAANWVSLYIQGPEEVSNPLYIASHRNDAKALAHLKGIKNAGGL